jgi:hypothetical protein
VFGVRGFRDRFRGPVIRARARVRVKVRARVTVRVRVRARARARIRVRITLAAQLRVHEVVTDLLEKVALGLGLGVMGFRF